MARVWVFVVLMIAIASCSALVQAQIGGSIANTVLQWGGMVGSGIGGQFRTNGALPPTPISVYDENPTVPLDEEEYYYGTDGYWTMMVTRKSGQNRFFIFGTLWTGQPLDEVIIPSPIEITQTIQTSEPDLLTLDIIKVQVVGSSVALAVYTLGPSNKMGVEVYTFVYPDIGSKSVIGRSPDETMRTPTAIVFPEPMFLTNAQNLIFECGGCYCFLSNGTTIVHWGSEGQCIITNTFPIVPPGLVGLAINQVIAGPDYAMVIAETGNSWFGWGYNTNGRFGDSTDIPFSSTLLTFIPPANPQQVACGSYHCVVLFNRTHVAAWGSNDVGQAGVDWWVKSTVFIVDYDFLPFLSNEHLDRFQNDILSVGAIRSTSFVLAANGLWAFGFNMDSVPRFNYAFGTSTFISKTSKPQFVDTGYSPLINALKAPHITSYLVTDTADITFMMPCTTTVSNLTQIRSLKSGPISSNRLFLQPYRALITWGLGSSQKLEDDFSTDGLPIPNRNYGSETSMISHPVIVEGPELTYLSASWSENTAIVLGQHPNEPGNLRTLAWGSPIFSTFAEPALPPNASLYGPFGRQASALRPEQIYPDEKYEIVSMGGTFGCGVHVGVDSQPSTVNCWNIEEGEPQTSWPVSIGAPVAGTQNPRISCSKGHCAFLPNSGTVNELFTWSGVGSSVEGLCRGMTSNTATPAQVTTSLVSGNLYHVSAGDAFTIVATDTELYGCGRTGEGQLGYQATEEDASFQRVAINVATTILQIVSGRAHTLVLTSDKKVYSFGSDFLGQTGTKPGNSINQSISFAAMPSGQNVNSIAAISDTSYALLGNGDMLAWGWNDAYGMFGGGRLYRNLAYTPIPQLVNISAVFGRRSRLEWLGSSSFTKNAIGYATFDPQVPVPTAPRPASELVQFGGSFQSSTNYFSPTQPRTLSNGFEVEIPFITGTETISAMAAAVNWDAADGDWTTFVGTSNGNLYQAATSGYLYPAFARQLSYPDYFVGSASPLLRRVYQFDSGIKALETLGDRSVALLESGTVYVIHSSAISAGLTDSLVPLYQEGGETIPDGIKIGASGEYEGLRTYGVLTSRYILYVQYFQGSEPNSWIAIPGVVEFAMTYSSMSFIHFDYANIYTVYVNATGIWAINIPGGLGRGRDVSAATEDFNVTSNFSEPLHTIIQLDAGDHHMLLLTQSGKIYGFGSTSMGELPFSKQTPASFGFEPLFENWLEFLPSRIVKVAALSYTSFAISLQGDLYVWGAYYRPSLPNSDLSTSLATYNALHSLGRDFEIPTMLPSPTKRSKVVNIVGARHNPDATSTSLFRRDLAFFAYGIQGQTAPSEAPASPQAQTPTATGCSPNPPNTRQGWVCDTPSGTWVFRGNLVVDPSEPLELSSATRIEGSLTISPGSTVTIKLNKDIFNSLQGTDVGTPLLNVTGCATIESTMEASLDDEAVKEVKKSGKDGKKIVVIESSCSQQTTNRLIGVDPKSEKGCRRYTAKEEQAKTENQRHTINSVFVVTRDTCNQWWIILVAVVGSVVVFVVVTIVIVMATPLKEVVLPFLGINFQSKTTARQGNF
jgi:alpha-tubulin suppressor-like RCC1 family protein